MNRKDCYQKRKKKTQVFCSQVGFSSVPYLFESNLVQNLAWQLGSHGGVVKPTFRPDKVLLTHIFAAP